MILPRGPVHKKPGSTPNSQSSRAVLAAHLIPIETATMNKFVLFALVSCSFGILMQAVISEEPIEAAVKPVDEEQTNDFGAKGETIDSSDEGFEDELNEDNAPDDEEDEEDIDEDEDLDEEDYDEDEPDDDR